MTPPDPTPCEPALFEPTLREMAWTDIPVLAAMESELFGSDAWSEAVWWSELAGRPRRDYLVAQTDRVVGYAGLDHGGDVADIMTVAVAPASRGRGVGDLLLTELLCRGQHRGAHTIMLEVRADNVPAQALYARHGFEQVAVRRRYYQPGDVDALVLRADVRRSSETTLDGSRGDGT